MFPCCNPKLYWIPKKPTFMFTICANDKRGRAGPLALGDGDAWALIARPLEIRD
jgi:hypothetical protein